jgi:hypothetical protein
MSVIINKFNVNGIPIFNQNNKYMHKYIELIFEFKFNNENLESRIEIIRNRLENVKKLDKSLNIYYKNKYQKININELELIIDNIQKEINENNFNLILCYNIPDNITNSQLVNTNIHVKYSDYSLEGKTIIYYLYPFLNHVNDYHTSIKFNHIGELEIII